MNTQAMFVCLFITMSSRCILLLIICQLCVTRYRGFVYILSTVLPYFLLLNSWLLLAGGISAIARLIVLYCFIFPHQPEAGTGRRHLRHRRPVDCIVLFPFLLSNETALVGGTSATVIRLTFPFLLSNKTALVGGTSATVIRLTFLFSRTIQIIYCLKYCVAKVLLFDDILLCYYTCSVGLTPCYLDL